jgi:hypothetical protein
MKDLKKLESELFKVKRSNLELSEEKTAAVNLVNDLKNDLIDLQEHNRRLDEK